MEKKNYYFEDVFGFDMKILKPKGVSVLNVADVVTINNKRYVLTKIF